MRDLVDIIEACKLNEKPSVDELRYAVIALASLDNLAMGVLMDSYRDDTRPLGKTRIEDIYKAHNTALNKSPKEWLGWGNDPENPEYQRFHAMGVKLLEKALRGEPPNQEKQGGEV